MPKAVTAVLFVFWILMAYRAFQRGDLLMAGVLFAVGIVLSVYRLGLVRKRSGAGS